MGHNKHLALLILGTALIGCGAEPDQPLDLTPAHAELGPSQVVSVEAANETWTWQRLSLDRVDFGPGIDVLDIELTPAGHVDVRIYIHEDAPLGPRDVVIDGVWSSGGFTVNGTGPDPLLGGWVWMAGDAPRANCGPIFFGPDGNLDEQQCAIFGGFAEKWYRVGDDEIFVERGNTFDLGVTARVTNVGSDLVLTWNTLDGTHRHVFRRLR